MRPLASAVVRAAEKEQLALLPASHVSEKAAVLNALRAQSRPAI